MTMITLGTAVLGFVGLLPCDVAPVTGDDPLFLGLTGEDWIITVQYFVHWRLWSFLWLGEIALGFGWYFLDVDMWIPRLLAWAKGY